MGCGGSAPRLTPQPAGAQNAAPLGAASQLAGTSAAPASSDAVDELPARLALLFERLPKLLTEKKNVAKCKLRENLPRFTAVATTLVDGYIDGKMRSCEALVDALEKIIPDCCAEEHM
eukprot:4183144-Prymnesium_polylepis.1